jgi:hypothetical protein
VGGLTRGERVDQYRGMGWCLVRAGADKRPIGRWREFQKRQPTEDEWAKVRAHAEAGGDVFLVCGGVSGVAVLDLDTKADPDVVDQFRDRLGEVWERAPRATTPSDGRHLYFAVNGVPVKSNAGSCWDWQAEGKGVVVPLGGEREWEVPLGELPSASEVVERLGKVRPGPDAGMNGSGTGRDRPSPTSGRSGPPSGEGERNEWLARVGGGIARRERDWRKCEASFRAAAAELDTPLPESEVDGMLRGSIKKWWQEARDDERTRGYEVKPDAKGKLILPAAPEPEDVAGQCAWLTAVFDLDRAHPITGGARQGLRGAAGHVELRRLNAPPLRFEPASRLNAAVKLVEDLSWQALPSDGPTRAFTNEHCRQIVYVVRTLCGASQAMTDEQETGAILGAYLTYADEVDGLTTYGTVPQRYEAAMALRREVDEFTGRPRGTPRYLVDTNIGELVVPVGELQAVARQYLGVPMPNGWLDARMEAIGWVRVQLDGRELGGREGRHSAHARINAYRGHVPHEEG